MSLISRGTFAATVLVTLSPDLSGNFVATGAADEVEINAAIVYCAAIGGGEVVLGQGGFVLAATVNVPAGVLLRGMGWTTILNYDAGGACVTFTGDNAKLRDLKIVITAGAGAGGSRPNGIIADTRTNIEVSGVWFFGDKTVANDGSDLRQNGVYFATVTESRVILSRYENVHRMGIYLTSSDDNFVNENLVTGTAHGIHLYQSDNNTINDNRCLGNTQHGIYNDNSSDFNTFTGNDCNGNTVNGIYLDTSSTDNTVTGNNCNGNSQNGIRLDDSTKNNTITGNTCKGNTQNGIYVRISCDFNTVTGNTCNENARNGITLQDASENTVTGNTCVGNDSGDTATYSGIQLEGLSDDNIIHSNTCNNNDKYGINIFEVACNRNWVKNNQLRNNTAGAFNDVGTDTKTPFINVLAPNPDAYIGTHAVQQMADGIDSIIRFEVPIPREYQETVTAEVLLVAGGTGDLRRAVATNWGQFGTIENYDVGSDTIAAGQVAVLVDDMTALDIAAAFTGIASEDWIGVEFTRGASNVLDTIGAAVYFIGFRLRYV